MRIATGVLLVRGFLLFELGAVGGVCLLVVVAERDDQLRDARVALHLDLDAVDQRRALAAGGRVFEVELLANLEEPELAERRDARALRPFHARAHRRREAFDVESNFSTLRRMDGHSVLDHADDPLERDRAGGIEIREPDPELATLAHVVLPQDLTGGDDDHPLSRVEPTRDGLTDFGKVGGAKVHAFLGQVHCLRLERRTQRAANLDHSIERDPRRLGRAAIACSTHEDLLRTEVWS